MQDACGQHGVGTGLHRRCEMVKCTCSATGDDRYIDDRPHCGDHLQVVAVLRAVGVHGVEQDLACAELSAAGGPLERVDPRAPPATVRGHLEAVWQVGPLASARVDRQDEDLPAEPFGDLSYQLWPLDRGCIDRHLVCPSAKEPVDVIG